ncbi:MAG: metallophosphoesterase [Stagnimonas sp.]|nr:metallophosphoesterase [Stagnimonas sp.]
MKISSTLAALVFSVPLFAACGISQPPDAGDTTPVTPVTPPAPKVRFIAFGDAGRGNDNQIAVGAAMAQLCQLKGCDFALETGDNFYETGVTSVTDAQWQSAFEVPYKDLNIPIYATLGNHDNANTQIGEGFNNAKGNFQVDYTTDAVNTTKKWKMPARYHAFTAPLNAAAGTAPIIEFFCLDSSPLTATIPNLTDVEFNYLTYGPTQMQWFQNGLMATKAKWTIAYSHHPYISNGEHGNAGNFDGTGALPFGTTDGQPWKDLMDQSACAMGLDFHIFGHDHDLEWLKPTAGCNTKTEFILSGAGSDVRAFGDATLNEAYFQQDMMQGFFWFEVTDTAFIGETYILKDAKLQLDAVGKPMPSFTRTVTK